MSAPFETFEHAGLTVELHYDDDARTADPRDCDNLGRMVCWHPCYALGDCQVTAGDGLGAVVTGFERDDFKSMEHLERWLRVAKRAVVVLPLYLLDHSGLAMTAGSNTVGRGDTASGGRDSWGNPHGWDTTMVGFIFTTAERCAELCGTAEAIGLYKPTDFEGTALAWVTRQLEQEVGYYNAFLSGQVYGFLVKDERGEIVDDGSLWGMLADPYDGGDGLEYVRAEARAAAEAERDYRAKRRLQVSAGWALAHGMRLSAGWSA